MRTALIRLISRQNTLRSSRFIPIPLPFSAPTSKHSVAFNMPRRSRASLAAEQHPNGGLTAPNDAVVPPLVEALEHIPPSAAPVAPMKVVPLPQSSNTDDDLTPPPPAYDEATAFTGGVGEAVDKPKRKRGSKAAETAGNGGMEKVASPRKASRRSVKQEENEIEQAVEEPPATTPKRKRSSRAAPAPSEPQPATEVNGEVPPEATSAPPKRKRASKASKAPRTNGVAADEGSAEEKPITTPKRKRTPRAKVATPSGSASTNSGNGDSEAEEEGEGKPAKVKKEKKKTPKKSRLAKDEPEYDSEGNEIVKKKRKPKVYPKIEYDIPPVDSKTTNFKGRLGYACLNTVLRGTKPDSIFCSRTCRIASILEEGMELPKGLGMMNVKDLKVMIEWNEQNNIRFLRMSSEMFPFASHDKYGYNLSYAAAELKEAGDLAKKYGHRLTMHPGQFTQLGSPKEGVVKSSIRELDYQCEIMDRMGLDKDGVMIIHMGGIYGDKESTLARFKENYTRLKDNVKARLVLENDEICYNVDDLLPISRELDIPLIFDYHHDWINPSSEPPSVIIPQINEIWHKRGIRVKQHLSEPRPGAETVMEKRAHADRCKALPPDLPEDVDLMIEAKDKEQAVFELYRIYNLQPVIHDNLRPPNPAPGLRTNGRKSSKKKTKPTGEVDSDGNEILLSDVEKEGDGEIGDESIVANRQVDKVADLDPETKHELEEAPPAAGKQEAAQPVPPVPAQKKRARKSA